MTPKNFLPARIRTACVRPVGRYRALARAARRTAHRAALGGVAALLVTGCYIDTQRHPGPMEATVDPLPPGTTDLYPAGPEEVLVVRISDPVYVRRPGEASSYPLYFYRKQARMNAGSWVFSGAGGRAEVLYADNSTITLFGLGSGVVGSPSRQEPLFDLRQVERARIELTSLQQVRLLGGAILESETGPFILERPEEGILRIRNRSKGEGRIAYRDEVVALDPGQVLDMPLLDSGTGPSDPLAGFQRLAGADGPLEVRGEVELLSDPDGVRLRATGEHEVRGYGLRVRLDPGDEVIFGGLEAPEEPAQPEQAQPDPDSDPDPDPDPGSGEAPAALPASSGTSPGSGR